jgi:hypothetical protein
MFGSYEEEKIAKDIVKQFLLIGKYKSPKKDKLLHQVSDKNIRI